MITEYIQQVQFARPEMFWLLLIIPIWVGWYFSYYLSRKASVPVSVMYKKGMGSWRDFMVHIPMVLRSLVLLFVITALAQPQKFLEEEKVKGEGIDIILCLDVSGSMTQRDFVPNRLEAMKKVATDFVKKRRSDRIGVVVFAEDSFTLCPLTNDYPVVLSSIASIRNRMLQDGTSIGSGLSTSVDRLRLEQTKSKVVLLLTDGENNGGLIDPNTAKEIAKVYGVKVYTIGIGSDGQVPQLVESDAGITTSYQKVHIDEQLLTQIATETGGKYFRARDEKQLIKIYDDIDELEKSEFEVTKITRQFDYFQPLLWIALGLLLLEMLLRYTVLRGFP